MNIRATNLFKTYQERQVVKDVSLYLSQGEIVGLLGPNGAGKTTTFYMMVGLVAPTSGSIMLDQKDITSLPMFQRAWAGIGYLPQEPSVFRRLSVEDNLRAVLETIEGLSIKEQHSRLELLLKEFNLEHLRSNMANSLSGGERRRVEVARALVRDPKFLLLDEPFAGVDPIVISELQKIIGLLAARGIGVLITDHNVRSTLEICQRAYILADGKIVEEGSPEKIATSEVARRYYLGNDFAL